MLFILHRVGIVILSTKNTVTLVSVDAMKINYINLNFPSPRSEPREVIEVGFVHEHVKVLMILILYKLNRVCRSNLMYLQIACPLLGIFWGTNANKVRKSVQIQHVNTFLNRSFIKGKHANSIQHLLRKISIAWVELGNIRLSANL